MLLLVQDLIIGELKVNPALNPKTLKPQTLKPETLSPKALTRRGEDQEPSALAQSHRF